METVLCKLSDDVLVYAGSLPGVLCFTIPSEKSVEPWIVYNEPSEKWRKSGGDQWLKHTWGGFYIDIDNAGIVAPYWFLVSVFATVGTLPWIHHLKWRYSLRTLLIGTTLVAVVLGLIVAVLRWPAG